MPRETIRPGDSTYDIHVGWDRAGYAQLAVELPHDGPGIHSALVDDESARRFAVAAVKMIADSEVTLDQAVFVDAYPGNPRFVELGRQLVDKLDLGLAALQLERVLPEGESWSESPGPDYFGLWATLDRHSINELIRLLRRARDSAFGRDE